MDDDGPPPTTDRDSPPDITDGIRSRYPETPMPTHFHDDSSDTGSDERVESSAVYETSMKVLFIAIAIAHLWTVWTLSTDMNIMMQFLRELTQQNKHITDLLHNQHQVKWQIVPTQL